MKFRELILISKSSKFRIHARGLLKKLLEPFGIKHYFTDGLGAYRRHLAEDKHEIEKKKTQKMSRNVFAL